jgi:hypothetical protein
LVFLVSMHAEAAVVELRLLRFFREIGWIREESPFRL